MLPSIGELNELGEREFAEAVGPLFEGASDLLRRLAEARPFPSHDQMVDRAEVIARSMPETAQVELIDSHPRIGAEPASVSALSHREQGYDRDAGTAALQARLEELNTAYEERFGFRFVIFVAGRPRSAIVPIIEERLMTDRQAEQSRALSEIFAIARDRLSKMGARQEGR